MNAAGVGREFHFHAAHFDADAPPGDKCGRVHGHTYRVEITAYGRLDVKRGMLIHGDELKVAFSEIHTRVDHQLLNEVLPFNPTMENVCQWISEEVGKYLTSRVASSVEKVKVRLYETQTMFAEVTHYGRMV